MNKIILALIICVLSVNLATAIDFEGAKQIFKVDVQSERVPAGKVIKIRLHDDLNSLRSLAGDQFSASLAQDITIKNKIILPAGTIMRGVVEAIQESSRPKSPAILYLSFDHLVTPIGRQVPMTLRLINIPNLTADGGLSAGGSYYETLEDNFDQGVEFIKKSVNFGLNTGDVAKYFVTPVTAVGGSCFSVVRLFGTSIINFFQKGNEVVIPQGHIISTMLTEPLDIPTN